MPAPEEGSEPAIDKTYMMIGSETHVKEAFSLA
jgi:hypothetical protein